MTSTNQHRYSIGIVGTGNMAWHLGHKFLEAGHTIRFVAGRTPSKVQQLAIELGAQALPVSHVYPSADFTFLALSDDQIAPFAQSATWDNTILLHASGSISIDALSGTLSECGVFYPFQSLTKGIEVDFRKVHICIEATDENITQKLESLARSISGEVHRMHSEQRRILHLAGVMVNNFTNYLYSGAVQLLQSYSIEPVLLEGLLQETALKVTKGNPDEIQTGPARRNNQQVIRAHLELLKGSPQLVDLYALISKQIIEKYHGPKPTIEF